MNNKDKLHDEVETMSRQFSLGAHIAIEMLKDGQLPFDEWYKKVTLEGDIAITPLNNLRLIWIWDTLRKDQNLKDVFQDLSPAGMRWNRNSPPILAMKKGSWFLIGLSRNAASALLFPPRKPPQEELVVFQLLDDLFMQPGRNDRLECCDCPCLLQLRPDEVYTKERESDIMGIDMEQIKFLGKGVIQVEVPSINQAYTVASRRLEPKRRSHGGNVYEHVVYADEQRDHRLENIRLLVELGEWGTPSPPRTNSSNLPLFPDEPT